MTHERSTTIRDPKAKQGKPRWINLPTMVNGKNVGVDGAVRRYKAGALRPLGGRKFNTMKQAVDAAKRRSKSSK